LGTFSVLSQIYLIFFITVNPLKGLVGLIFFLFNQEKIYDQLGISASSKPLFALLSIGKAESPYPEDA
jgi:hypothetical protein